MGRQPAKNPWVGVNYFNRDTRMEVPPAYWLQRLYDFDADLVVFPSIGTPFAYVLARRARRTGGMNILNPEFAHAQPDTKFCVANHLLPVSKIYRTGVTWSIDNILNDLRSRDTWAAGGGEKFADRIEHEEATAEQKRKDALKDDMYNRSGDAWRSYQARTGQRTKYRYGHEHATQTSVNK